MSDTLKALALAGGFLLAVVGFIAGISYTTVSRGERSIRRNPAMIDTKPQQWQSRLHRRAFISWIGVAWAAFTSSALVSLGATGRYMFPNVLFEPPSIFKAGQPETLQVGEVDERFKETNGVWLVKDKDPTTGNLIIYALSDICTHLGCIPNWLQSEQKFKCPCHGSGYYKSGINFEGPTPRPLERFEISLGNDGQILVDKSHKFQQEKGEWTDPRSFIAVSS